MKILLDTHCLIWALADAPELDAKARRAIGDADSVWFSEASIWELGLKWRKGKIGLQPRRVFEQAQRDRFLPMPITIDAILLSSELRQTHSDPFDRLLYAQARISKCTLLTIDRTLTAFGSRILTPKQERYSIQWRKLPAGSKASLRNHRLGPNTSPAQKSKPPGTTIKRRRSPKRN